MSKEKPKQKRNDAVIVPKALVDTFLEMWDDNGTNMAGNLIRAYFRYWLNGEAPEKGGAEYWLMKPYLEDANRLIGGIKAKSERAKDAAEKRWNINANASAANANASAANANASKIMPYNTIQDNTIQDSITPPTIPPRGKGGGDVDWQVWESVSKWLQERKHLKDDEVAKAYVSYLAGRKADGEPIHSPASYFDKWYCNVYVGKRTNWAQPNCKSQREIKEEQQREYEAWCKANGKDHNDLQVVLGYHNGHNRTGTTKEQMYRDAAELVEELLAGNGKGKN